MSVPFNIVITLLGFQFLSKELDDMAEDEARSRLRKLGLESPDINILLKP